MDVAPFFFWSFLGFSSFSEGNPFRMEGLFCGKEEEGRRGNWDRYVCFGSYGRLEIQLLSRIAGYPSKSRKFLLCIYYGRKPICE